MRKWTGALFTCALIVGLVPVLAHAQTLAVYDAFDAPAIDPVKWRGTESASSLGIVSTENFRRIVSGELQLALTTHTRSGSGTGLVGEARSRLLLNHPALVDGIPAITAMRATVAVLNAVAQDCTTEGSAATTTHAGIFAVLFNDTSGSPSPADATGDVIGVIDLRKNSRDGRQIIATLARCGNASCSAADVLSSAVFGRTWAFGERVTLVMRWQKLQSRVLFQATSAAGSESRALTYTATNTEEARSFLKDLRVNNALPFCAAGPVKAAMNARFDQVMINETAVNALGE
jgi:hypothetical protein